MTKNNAWYIEGEIRGIDTLVIVTHTELYQPFRGAFTKITKAGEVKEADLDELMHKVSRGRKKYVIGTLGNSPFEMAVVFPDWINHVDIARVFTGKVVGAGFVYFKNKVAHPYSESIGLKMGPSPTDHAVLRWTLGDRFWKKEVKRG